MSEGSRGKDERCKLVCTITRLHTVKPHKLNNKEGLESRRPPRPSFILLSFSPFVCDMMSLSGTSIIYQIMSSSGGRGDGRTRGEIQQETRGGGGGG